jgi:cbb3-type cytochrome oxidase subunit 1
MTHPGRIAVTLVKIAAVYLLASLAIGMYMAITHNHALVTVHSHVGLLGWMSMALTGVAYMLWPACAGRRLAAAHFWLHNAGLPIMLGALVALILTGDTRAEPVIGAGSTLVVAGLTCFTVNLFRHAHPDARGGSRG